MLRKIAVTLMTILFLTSCSPGDDTSTSTTYITDSRQCILNTFSGDQVELFDQAEFADIDITVQQEGFVLCGDPVSIDAVITNDSPEDLAKFLATGLEVEG